jgi:hypothetical protein
MRYENDGVVLLSAVLSLLLVVLGLLNLPLVFAFFTCVLMVVLVVMGYARRAPLPALAALLLAYLALFTAVGFTDRPAEALSLVLGLPKSTSFVVYGIWPLGFLFGVVYFWFFPNVLPPERLEKFLNRFREK